MSNFFLQNLTGDNFNLPCKFLSTQFQTITQQKDLSKKSGNSIIFVINSR